MVAEDLSTEKPEPPGPDDEHVPVIDFALFRDAAGRREGLRKDGFLVAEFCWDLQKIFDGEREVLGECAVLAGDAEDGSMGALLGAAESAGADAPGREIDGSHDSFSGPLGGAFARLNHSDKLMAEDAIERIIAPCEFKIGRTDSCQSNPNERLLVVGDGVRSVGKKT